MGAPSDTDDLSAAIAQIVMREAVSKMTKGVRVFFIAQCARSSLRNECEANTVTASVSGFRCFASRPLLVEIRHASDTVTPRAPLYSRSFRFWRFNHDFPPKGSFGAQ